MAQEAPELSVVIPTYQGRETVRSVLAALNTQQIPAACFEVIVSVDGSTDGTVPMLTTLETPYCLRWIEAEQGGPGLARNRGAAIASGRILLFLDDDIVAGPALLAVHLQASQEEGERTVCLGQVRVEPGRLLSPAERYLTERFEEHYDRIAADGYQPDFWDCLSGNFSLQRRLWEESGGFAPAFAAGRHEDIELGYRLQQQGARFVYRPDACAYHRYVKPLPNGLRDARLEGRSAWRLSCTYQELTARLLHARWQRYPRSFRRILRYCLAHPDQHARLARIAAAALTPLDRLRLPLQATRPFYQVAFHLYFWWGLAQETKTTAGSGWEREVMGG